MSKCSGKPRAGALFATKTTDIISLTKGRTREKKGESWKDSQELNPFISLSQLFNKTSVVYGGLLALKTMCFCQSDDDSGKSVRK